MLSYNKIVSAVIFAVAGVAVPSLASAQTCVVTDTTKDNLAESERAGAKTLLEDALREEGLKVGEAPCDAPFTVYHVQFGKSINVVLSEGGTTQKLRAATLEDVPAVYSQLVHAIVHGTKVDTASDSTDRNNVTKAQSAPRRALADSLWYIRLGPGTILGGNDPRIGASFGGGYRYELDRLGIDVSFNLLAIKHDHNSADEGASGSFVRLMGLFFFDPSANASPYVAGGVSWGGSAVTRSHGETYSNTGLQGEAAVGYEFLRASTIRMFAQAETTLPFYKSVGDLSDRERYTPSFALSFGLGWGGEGNQITVHND